MKKIACLAVFFGLCVLVVAVSASEMRTWTSNSGKFTTEAEFIETSPDGTMVGLRKKDGKEIQVAMERLSEEDQEYVMRRKPAKKAEPAQKTAPPITKPSSIVTRQDCIDTILSDIDDAEARETVLKWFQVCKGKNDISYDKVSKLILCVPPMPSQALYNRYSFMRPAISVSVKDNLMLGWVWVHTCDNKAMFPKKLTIADKSGVAWESSREKWGYDTDIHEMKLWIREDANYFIYEITEKEADAVMGAIAKSDECVVRISGNGYRDIEVTAAKAQDFKLFYDAYKVLAKYYKHRVD